MERRQRVYFPTTKRRNKRKYVTVTAIEERFALLLLLLQHNFDKVLQRSKARRR